MRTLLIVGAATASMALAAPSIGRAGPPAGQDRAITTHSGEIIAVARRDRAKPQRRAQRPVRVCRKWCSADLNPCDPPSFKIADGRCSWDDL